MRYCRLTGGYIRALRGRFKEFIADTKKAIRKCAEQAWDDVVREANDDMLHGRYSESSVRDWAEKERERIQRWEKTRLNEVVNTEHFGKITINKMDDRHFYHKDLGTSYIMKFADGYLDIGTNDRNVIYVKAESMYFYGYCNDRKYRVDFKPPKVEFTEWMDEW